MCVHLFCAVHEFEAYQANLNIFRPKCHPGSDEVPSPAMPSGSKPSMIAVVTDGRAVKISDGNDPGPTGYSAE